MAERTYILGIDPGLKGGYCWLSVEQGYNPRVAECGPMPVSGNEMDIEGLFKYFGGIEFVAASSARESRFLVCVEKVHSMPGQGVASTFKFGRGFGEILGAAKALQIPTIQVPPQRWKKEILKDTARQKDDAIAWVKARYPYVELIFGRARKPHDGAAEAVCIASYGLVELTRQGVLNG